MNYLPQLKDALLDAARRRSEELAAQRSSTHDCMNGSPARVRFARVRAAARRAPRRMRGWRGAAINVALTAVAALGGLTASGAFERGPTVGAEMKPMPSTGTGVAIPSSVKLLPIRTPDPAGGPPWGLRLMRTSRDATCVVAGRVDFGTIGVLGVDDLFGNDGLFHPLSTAIHGRCANSDANGHAFLNVALEGVPISGVTGDIAAEGCRPTEEGPERGPAARALHLPRAPKAVRRRIEALQARERSRPRCPFADLREIYYGLLGPEAVSITYRTAEGRLQTTPTVGSDGAYLVVLRQPPHACGHAVVGAGRTSCQSGIGSSRSGPGVPPGAIASVTYRDGRTCHVPERSATPWRGVCSPVGYVAPAHRALTAADVASPVEVQRLPGTSFCERQGPITDEETEATRPCGAHVPSGYERIDGPSEMIRLSFTAPVAIENDRSTYAIDYYFPRTATQHAGCDNGGGMGTSMSFNIKAGQRLSETRTFPLGCPGRIRGKVKYVFSNGPGGLRPTEPHRSLVVGRFSFDVP